MRPSTPMRRAGRRRCAGSNQQEGKLPDMKAVLSKEVGGPETLVVEDVEAPVPGAGEVLINVAACTINYPDTLIIKDMYQFKPPRPFSPGGEVSGTIAALGEGVTGWQVGDRVIAGVGSGGLREQVTLAA